MSPADIRTVLVVGAGGHARVCLEALTDDALHHVIGAVSSDGLSVDAFPVPMLGLDTDLGRLVADHGVDQVFVAVGDNAARQTLDATACTLGVENATAISRFAMISHHVQVHAGAAILPGAVVNAASTIGRGAIVNTNASVDHDCVIGDFSHVAPGVAVCGGVTVGRRVLLGVGSRVLPGITIGDDAVVGAGAVVVHDVPPGATVVGVPARTLRAKA